MIAFTGFVLAGVLVVVQFAAAQYSPRLILWFRRDALVKHAVGVFLASFIYSLVALRGLERRAVDYAPDVTVTLAVVLLVAAALLFLALLQRVLDRLRPRTLYAAVIGDGIRAARDIYPEPLADPGPAALDRSWERADAARIALHGRPGVVVSFDRDALVAAAAAAGATIELVPAVGEFVAPGATLLRVHGGDRAGLERLVLVEAERTVEQDPMFAARIVVDTAIRALSPAVNDPTTAVHGLDVLEILVRELAGRDLTQSLARDARGTVRLVWRTPGWSDVLDLAFDEIRQYGASSLQVCRRMRAVLEDLRAATPPARHPAIDEHLRRLDAAVAAAYPESERELATVADRTGLGLARPRASASDG
jgi:uncharacterized membrane protein